MLAVPLARWGIGSGRGTGGTVFGVDILGLMVAVGLHLGVESAWSCSISSRRFSLDDSELTVGDVGLDVVGELLLELSEELTVIMSCVGDELLSSLLGRHSC